MGDLTAAEREELESLNRIDRAVYRRGCERFLDLCRGTGVVLDAAAEARLAAASG